MSHHHTIAIAGGRRLVAALLILFFLTPLARAGAALTVEAQVESREVYVGQPFVLQLEISGAEASQQPAISLDDFRVEPQGGTNRSQSYRVFIDGKLQSSTSTTYTYQYLLTALRAGVFTIPAIAVTIDNASASTTPITMTVKTPEEIEAFKLRIQLAKQQCYQGEAITMTTTWLIGEELQGFEFNLPLFSDPRFALYAQPPAAGSSHDLVELEVAGAKVVAEKKALRRNGREYISLVFHHTLVPQQAGTFTLPPASLAINAFAGYSQNQGRPFGADPLAMFGSGRRKIYRTVVIPANDLTLEVLALPTEGRPPHFTGLVGDYTMAAEAGPTTVNVGDPITLTVHINGSFVDNLTLPALENVLPSRDFKVATDTPQASQTAGGKSFTTTIRAGHDQVHRIPGLTLPFFNPETRRYEVARSADIPLTVNPTRVLTAADALGGGEDDAGQAMASEARQDIRANYEELPAPAPRATGRLLTIALLVLPPLLFVLVFLVDYYRHDDSREARHRRRQAFRRLRKKLHNAEPDQFFEAWLEFLGDKLGRPARAITLDEVLAALAQAPAAEELAHQVREIFSQGEAALYGGMGHVLEKETLLRVAAKIAEVL